MPYSKSSRPNQSFDSHPRTFANPKQLPSHPAVEEFTALVKKSVGGIDLLGGAAATEQDVATLVKTAPTRITAHAENALTNLVLRR